jgi:cobalamin synthase
VGCCLGLLLWLLSCGLELWRLPLAAAALLLLFWAWSGDSLHLDGLADTVDGLASRRTGEALLEVMHDSRSGAFGVQALILTLLLKFAFLAALPGHLAWTLPLPLIFSRLLAALLCQERPYAGRLGSLSAWFIEGSLPADLSVALACAVLASAALCVAAVFAGWAPAPDCAKALFFCGLGLLLGWVFVQVPRRRLGGISGDLIGYGVEVAEISSCYLILLGLGRP